MTSTKKDDSTSVPQKEGLWELRHRPCMIIHDRSFSLITSSAAIQHGGCGQVCTAERCPLADGLSTFTMARRSCRCQLSVQKRHKSANSGCARKALKSKKKLK